MKLIKQVISDLFKEAGWVVLYGFLTAMVIMAFILIGLSYQSVAGQSSSVSRFVNNGITIIQSKSAQYRLAPHEGSSLTSDTEIETLDSYFTDVFSATGNAGTYLIMSGRCGYQQVIILLGAYADLTPFQESQAGSVIFAVSNDIKDSAEKTIEFNGNEYPLYVAPADMELYHPLNYLPAGSQLLQETLFVFSHDYEAIKEIFPKSVYGEMQESSLLSRFILQAPSTQDIVRMKMVISSSTGAYVSTQTIEEYLSSTSAGSTRTYQTYLVFYISASIILFGAMIINIYRVLKRKIPDYSVHHLFGASQMFIYLRMFLFTLGYHAIPFLGTILIMSLNGLVSPISIALLFVGMIGFAFLITSAVYNSFQSKFAQGLRRE